MSISQKPLGVDLIGRQMTLFTMTNKKGASVSVLDFGAHLTSIKVPDKNGALADVCLGFDTYEEYDRKKGSLGATIGRYGNRIGKSRFMLNGTEYTLFPNNNGNSLHGGREGFDKKWWKGEGVELPGEDMLIFTYVSHDGEEGYPGKLQVQVSFAFDDNCSLAIRYLAQSDKDTVINMTNHAYFNLAGEGTILDHTLQINADNVTDVDTELIPTGEFLPVAGTQLDFTQPRRIGEGIEHMDECRLLSEAKGYDINYCLRGEGLRQVAVLHDDKSGRTMKVSTSEPGVQVYTAQHLDTTGHGGAKYGAYAGVALETQHYPDSPNKPLFPSTTLKAGDTYQSTTVYAFSVE